MRQDVSRLKILTLYIKFMFPYNETENAWISGNKVQKIQIKHNNQSLIVSTLLALTIALFSAVLPTLIYFTRFNLF